MSLPQIRVTGDAAKRLRNWDCWVFRDELITPYPAVAPGELVEVADRHGHPLGCAFMNERSHIALRLLSSRADEEMNEAFFRARLLTALHRRDGITGTNAKRLVFSEADGLPGLIVDQYGEHLVLQIRSAGMERFRPLLTSLLQELTSPKGILERSDKEFRKEEGLEPVVQVLAGQVPDRLQIEEDGLRFWVDPHRGLKTGFYLDQRQTRRRLRTRAATGQRVLDTFSYTGSLGIAAASTGAHVVCVEQQEAFLELAKENAKLNHVEDRMEFVAGNAFYWLVAQAQAGAQLDWVVLDPPSLAKTRSELQQGRQALHHLLVHGLRLTKPEGGVLLSICTYHLLNLTEEILRIAAGEARVRLAILDQWLQAEDHPWIVQIPATRYLASWLVARDE